MTDKEIIQALNTATNVDGLQICCIDYENNPKNAIYLSIKSDILDLINRQQAEIERLLQKLQQPQTEAIKEFAEKLKDLSCGSDLYDRDERWVQAVTVEEIDETYKEMVGDSK